MIDPASLAAGAGVLATGWLVGHVTGRHAERRRLDKPQEPICGCTHHLAHHDRDGGCHVGVKTDRWTQRGAHAGYEYLPCPCRQYVGPEPISSVWVPPVAIEGK